MVGAGIHDGDLLVVDRSLEPTHDRVVIAVLDGELTVKRLWRRDGCLRLLAENPAYAPLEVGPDQELVIWGVVTNVIHAL
jgi:DNA polymerase V